MQNQRHQFEIASLVALFGIELKQNCPQSFINAFHTAHCAVNAQRGVADGHVQKRERGETVQVVLVAAAAQALLAEFDEKRRQGKRKRRN